MQFSIMKRIVAMSVLIPLSLSVGHSAESNQGSMQSVISYLLLDDGPTIITGPSRVVEATADDVAEDFNNSRSTPLARHEDYVYWVYVATDNPGNPTEYFIKLNQIKLPQERVAGPEPYAKTDYSFINNYSELDHELRVFDGSYTFRDLSGRLRNDLDKNHTAPSVGVDRQGYIHVIGGIHNSSWEYCVSTTPNDITDFVCPTEVRESWRLPPNDRVTYARFFKNHDGKLYLSYRGRYSSHWHNGTSFAALAVYDESSKAWSSLGNNNYVLGDNLLQANETASLNTQTGKFLLPIDPKWLTTELDLPVTLNALFYSTSGAYHRYFRNPDDGTRLPFYLTYGNSRYAYQAYATDLKIDRNGRIHAAVVVRNQPNYDPDEPGANPGSIHTESSNDASNPVYEYDEKEYVMNYDYGLSILYAYSDDKGQSFRAPNGEFLDTPISPEPLSPLIDQNSLASATVQNGGIAYQDKSALILSQIDETLRLSLNNDGKPIIYFRENLSDGSRDYSMKGIQWTGSKWEAISSANRIGGTPGGLFSDGAGGMWAFESYNAGLGNIPSSPTSAGGVVLYSNSGVNGPWVEVASPWRNGLRVDTHSAISSNVMRYVDMNIQDGGTSSVISLIPPQHSD